MDLDEKIREFQGFLRTRGLKLTQQREVILRRVLALEKHFSAEELFEMLRAEQGGGISKATVYRTLALFVEGGVLDALDFERGHMLYERAADEAHHDHLICVACKRIFEFHNEEIERLQELVAKRHDFDIVSHTHQIYGVCGRCRRQGATAEDGEPKRAVSRRAPRVPS